jgi:ABC-2 type transport system permease protein
MSTPANGVPDSPLESRLPAPALASTTQPFYWCVRRELWENRAIYVAPLIVSGVYLFGFLIRTVTFPHKMRALAALDAEHQHAAILAPYHFIEGVLMVTAMIVGIFYCLDAFYGERRDRSVLFWKSLPVSDLTTVLSKAVIPMVILQLLAFAFTVAVQLVMLFLSTVALLASDMSVATLWSQLMPFRMWFGLLYHLVTIHGLWHAPFYAWLLLVSAWARRAPFLWAFLPPLAIGVFEKVVFNTSHFASWLLYHLAGGPETYTMSGTMPLYPEAHLTPLRFLLNPGLWIGLAVTAAFLAAAARLRRYREPI